MGCATPVPFREQSTLNDPNVSRLTITSINESNPFDRTSVLPGKVYVNGVYQGNFSSEQRTFTMEFIPSSQLVVVCTLDDLYCAKLQLSLQPNKHFKYKYFVESKFLGIAVNNIWKLDLLSTEDYKIKVNAPSTNNSTGTSVPPKAESEIRTSMENAKRKCSELGFKLNTQSFGECVLKLSN